MVRVQRLNGSGYMYSASNPPYTAAAAASAILQLENKPDLAPSLQRNSILLHSLLSVIPQLEIESFEQSPFKMVRLVKAKRPQEPIDEVKLYQKIVDLVRSKGVAITRSKYSDSENFPPPPQIKVCVMARHTKEQLQQVAQAISDALDTITV